jgi:hypothetical protein
MGFNSVTNQLTTRTLLTKQSLPQRYVESIIVRTRLDVVDEDNSLPSKHEHGLFIRLNHHHLVYQHRSVVIGEPFSVLPAEVTPYHT